MKVVSVFIFDGDDCTYVEDLQFVSYFNRRSVSELMRELVREAVRRVDDMRKIYEHPPWQVVTLNMHGKRLAMVTDNEYPVSVAYEILMKLCDEPSLLSTVLENCQDPRAMSPLYRLQQNLGDTLVIMHENVDKMLERGEDIARLVEKSERLSATSKTFYKVARTHNRCCVIS